MGSLVPKSGHSKIGQSKECMATNNARYHSLSEEDCIKEFVVWQGSFSIEVAIESNGADSVGVSKENKLNYLCMAEVDQEREGPLMAGLQIAGHQDCCFGKIKTKRAGTFFSRHSSYKKTHQIAYIKNKGGRTYMTNQVWMKEDAYAPNKIKLMLCIMIQL